jgi:hypothetical protein
MVVVFTSNFGNHDENVSRIQILLRQYILPAVHRLTTSKVILWTWYILTAASLLLVIWDFARGLIPSLGFWLAWVLITAIFGPVGLLAYLLSYRHPQTARVSGWSALGSAVFSTTGNAVGLILLTVFQTVFLPDGSVVLLVLPVSFLIGWLFFRAPLMISRMDGKYLVALRRTLLTEIISTNLVLAGMFPVVILLLLRWYPSDIDLTSPLFWITMSFGAIAGAVIAYPFTIWMVRRGFGYWPGLAAVGGNLSQEKDTVVKPSLRNAWWVLLPSITILIVAVGLLITSLS